MWTSQHPVIPGERSSSRLKKPVDYRTLNNSTSFSPSQVLSSPSALMNSSVDTRKRKSTSSTQDGTPQASTKRRKTIKPEPQEILKTPKRAPSTTSVTKQNAGSSIATSKRKLAGRPRRNVSQMVQDLAGEAPSGLEAQNLGMDPDGYRDKMVRSDPTKGDTNSTGGSISKQPKKRPARKPRETIGTVEDMDDQRAPIAPITPVVVAEDTKSNIKDPTLIPTATPARQANKSSPETQLPTPESTQEVTPPVEEEERRISSFPLPEATEPRYNPENQTQDDTKQALASSAIKTDPVHRTPEQAAEPVDPQSSRSSELSDPPSDVEMDSHHVGYAMEVSHTHRTNSTGAAIDDMVSEELVDPRDLTYTSSAFETAAQQPAHSSKQRELPRSRPRRSIKPPKLFEGFVTTPAISRVDAEEEDDGYIEESSSFIQASSDLENDHNEMDVDEEPVDDEDDVFKSDTTPPKTQSSANPNPVPPRRLGGLRARPTGPGSLHSLVTLKLPMGPPPVKMRSAKAIGRDLSTDRRSSGARETLKAAKQITSSNVIAARGQPPLPALVIDETGLDQTLLELSKKLSHREPLGLKPGSSGKPEVWADSRQALCETVPYFRMPQSGCHQNDGHVYAFLFDATGHCREYMDTDVVISRAGGGMEGDGSGQMFQKKDHLMSDAQVKSVLNDIEYQNPVVIIAGNRHEGAICKLPHRYNVLGWYKPVAVWAEKTLGKGSRTWTTIKYRFERLDPTTTPWHAPSQKALTEEEYNSVGALSFDTCSQCNSRYPITYLNGWMCLNPGCDQFWKLASGEDAPYGKLYYHPAFLLTRTRWSNEQEPFSVRPPIPNVGGIAGDNLTFINTRGICCPQCGRCSSRRLFKGWKCENPTCTYQNFPKHIPVTPAALNNLWDGVGDNIGNGPALAKNKHEKDMGVKVTVSHRLGFKIYTYTFDGINGKLVHAVSNSAINSQPGGPNEMFAAMQQQDDPGMDLHLERRRFNTRWIPSADISYSETFVRIQSGDHRRASDVETLRREAFLCQIAGNSATVAEADIPSDFTRQLQEAAEAQPETEVTSDVIQPGDEMPEAVEDGDFMTAFSINYGMPYKFVASAASLPFTKAPWPVRACHADLNWASKNFLATQGHQEFNELLIFAYLEGQKIEYHDDGESGLGPRISTLSLGGKAKMHLRMKQKHFVGCSKSGIFNTERPVPGSIEGPEMYAKRLDAWQSLQSLDLTSKTDRTTYDRRRKAIPHELGLFPKRTKKAPDLVTLTLNHGDIVLMEGYEIQTYLEHKVVPEGCLRFALTCRTVLPEHLRVEEKPRYQVDMHDSKVSCLYRMDEEERQKRDGMEA